MSTDIDPDEVFHRINNAGHDWVQKNAIATMLEESYKSELSTWALEYLAKGAKSQAEADSKARADDRAKDHIKQMVNAREAANEAKVTYEAAKTWWEATRTKAATMRQEMRMTS